MGSLASVWRWYLSFPRMLNGPSVASFLWRWNLSYSSTCCYLFAASMGWRRYLSPILPEHANKLMLSTYGCGVDISPTWACRKADAPPLWVWRWYHRRIWWCRRLTANGRWKTRKSPEKRVCCKRVCCKRVCCKRVCCKRVCFKRVCCSSVYKPSTQHHKISRKYIPVNT